MLDVPEIVTKLLLVQKERVELRSCSMFHHRQGFVVFILLTLSITSSNVMTDEIHNKQTLTVGHCGEEGAGRTGAGGSGGSRGVRSSARPPSEAVSPADPSLLSALLVEPGVSRVLGVLGWDLHVS